MRIIRDGHHFKDEHGRTLLLRGVNLAGTTKLPTAPNGATHIRDDFFNHHDVSFVGRPFPLEEADEHFRRLRSWGLTFLRFLVTWEAIEHQAPGVYDTAYLDYLEAVVDKAAEYDMQLLIDPHQDVWSRFTGGSGAPGWTLETVGFDITSFKDTGAALVHQTHGDPFPRMQWASNYSKLACATMFTLFFAGNDFAPKTLIEGEPAQEYLQRHFIAAMQQVATRLKDKPNVIAYEALNEPSKGYIGIDDIQQISTGLRVGSMPTPYQGMLLGAGYPQEVTEWTLDFRGMRRTDRHTMNTIRRRAWRENYDCIWRENGVWEKAPDGSPFIVRPQHFAFKNDEYINFGRDYLRPFINRYAQAIREIVPDTLIFVEFDPIDPEEVPRWTDDDAENIVFAPHWYEFLTLMTKRYIPFGGLDNVKRRPVLGRQRARTTYAENIQHLQQLGREKLDNAPTIIGEIGIPYDMNAKIAFATNNFTAQILAADDYFYALDTALAHATIWNYTPDNTNRRGDLWNGEDLSIFSRDQQHTPNNINSGGRALKAILRPYARATAGEPLSMSFDIETGVFEYEFRHDSTISEPTEFYVPNYQYPDGYIVQVSDGTYERQVLNQRLIYHHTDEDILHTIRIRPAVTRELRDSRRLIRVLFSIIGILTAFIWWRERTRE